MAVWWLAIAENDGYVTYKELRERRVIAQGWPDLGDLKADGRLAQLRNAAEPNRKEMLLEWLQQANPDQKPGVVVTNLANFFCGIGPGDFVIGKPGGRVAGICEMPPNPRYTYDDRYNYAHGFGPVTWYDWEDVSPDWLPSAPPQAPAACHVGNDHNRIENLCRAFIQRKRRTLAMEEWAHLLKRQRQIIFTGPPGTGKTRQAKHLAARMITGRLLEPVEVDQVLEQHRIGQHRLDQIEGGAWDIVQFHPSYNYDDFVRGIRVRTENGQVTYDVVDGPLLRMADQARQHQKSSFVLIIDEINRANVAAVLGEMIYALEYRESPVSLQYEKDLDAMVRIPKANLFIIGTMNTSDRSIGHIDYAVRRRFAFVPLKAERHVVEDFYQDSQVELRNRAIAAFTAVQALFSGDQSPLTPDYKASDVQPGHSYFLADDDDDLAGKLKYQVVPLLREYVADGVLRSDAETENAIEHIEKIGSP